jgi:hypothetical protein
MTWQHVAVEESLQLPPPTLRARRQLEIHASSRLGGL